VSKADRNRQRAREKIAQAKALEAKRKRRQRSLTVAGAVVVVAAAATGIALAVGNSGSHTSASGGPSSPHLKLAPLSTLGPLKPAPSPGPLGPESVPIPKGAAPLATTATNATGQAVDGVRCQTSEQTIFHIHAHLTVFVNGSPRQIPAEVGITGTCLYWLHTHAADGIIHIESPIHRTYTLGNFFDEWGQPLGPNQVGSATGHVTALYNGKVYQGNPRDIPLNAHAQVQLEVGTPLTAPESITWPSGL
jgi:hypothetical protein